MGYVFGIDLGTTYSCVAYLDEYGKPVVLKNSDGDHITPSVVFVESSSNIVVGMEAKRSVEMEPEKTVQFIKRKMGKENDKVMLNSATYSAPEVSAFILKKIVADANSELIQTGIIKTGEEVKDVVITCPAYFGMNERQATKTAGELAGLNVLNIINEPTAAAISYGVSGQQKDETVLVYDLGGGTFDITVMNITGGQISVVCTGGDDQLGGKDWDECLMDYVLELYQEEYDEDLSEDPETIATLYIDIETWKKSLTSREKINITVNGPAGRLRQELTREKYNELTENLLKRTKNLLDDALSVAEKRGYPLSRIDKVLLVGGSSRMPQVAEMLERDYHVQPVLADPDEAVAKGAAIFAANEKKYNDFIQAQAAMEGKTVNQIKEENLVNGNLDRKFAMQAGNNGMAKLSVKNVLSRTYGTDAYVGSDLKIVNMLMINDSLPATRIESFFTRSANQNALDIQIYESRSTEEEMEIGDKKPITTVEMIFNRPVPQGTEVKLTMSLDNSGLLHILAEEMFAHTKLDTSFQLSNQMSEQELQAASTKMSYVHVE